MIIRTLIFWLFLISTADAATLWISTTGTDAGDCQTEGSPCKTWAYVLASARLAAGDTVKAKDGTYLTSVHGPMIPYCYGGGGSSNGTSGSRITIIAENARQAHIKADNLQDPVAGLFDCNYWDIRNFQIENGNFAGSDSHTLALYATAAANTTNNIIAGNLVYNNNQLVGGNSHLISISGNSNTIEENECYNFDRHCIRVGSTNSANIMARNYCSQGNRNGAVTTCYTNYPSNSNIWVNNICESNTASSNLQCYEVQDTGATNKFYGNIANGAALGYFLTYATPFISSYPSNNEMRDFFCQVYSNSPHACVRTHGIGATNLVSGATLFAATSGVGVQADDEDGNPAATMTSYLVNVLAIGSGGTGFNSVAGVDAGTWDKTNAFGFTTAHTVDASITSTNATTTDPVMGSCKLWLPDASPLKGAGAGGVDLAATILYKYSNAGVLQTGAANRLWNPVTGAALFAGAIVTGVNDTAQTYPVLANIQNRLDIGINDCAFPTGYPDPPPQLAYGTANEACETVGTVLTAAGAWENSLETAANDTTFLLQAGTYTSANVIAITATGVTVKPENCAAVVVVGSWRLSGAPDNLTIAGMTIDDVQTTANGADNITIRNNNMLGGPFSAIRVRNSISGWTVTGNDANTTAGTEGCVTATFDFDLGDTAGLTITNLTVSGNRIKNDSCEDGLIINRWFTGNVVEDNDFFSLNTAASNDLFDLKSATSATSSITVRRNVFRDNGLASGASLLIHGTTSIPDWPEGATCIIEQNNFEDNNMMLRIGDGNNVRNGGPCTIRNNTFKGDGSAEAFNVLGATVGTKFYNNTIYNSTADLDASSSAAIVQNNIFHTATYAMVAGDIATCSHNVNFNGTGTFPTNCTNTLTADPLLTNPSNGDFTLSSRTSSAYNACTAVPGVGSNNPATDCGAYEILEIGSAVIGSVAANKIIVTFETNRYPGLAMCSTLGWSAKLNGADNPVTAVSCVGSVVTVTLTNASDNNDVNLVSYNATTGELIDLRPQAFSFGQKAFSFTDQPVTNQVTAEGAITYVAAGTSAVVTDGTSPVVGLPAGLAANDLMVSVLACRDADVTASIASGWTQLYVPVNDSPGRLILVNYRFYVAADTIPTWTINNNTDACIAQVAAWRGVNTTSPIAALGAEAINTGQQNIGPIPGVTVPGDGAIIVIGMKRDDWTSVATLSGDGLTWAEIDEPDTTSGGDMGLVWGYAIEAGGSAVVVTDKTFTVTGGGAGLSGKGMMFAINRDVTPPTSVRPAGASMLMTGAGK